MTKRKSGGLKGVDGELRWAGETERQTDGSDSAIDVELHLSELESSHHIFLSHGRQNQRTIERDTDLAAVRVAGEHQVDCFATRVFDDSIGVVRLVDHENHGSIRILRERKVEVGTAGSGIVGTAYPDTGACALNGNVFVDQDREFFRTQCSDDEWSVDGDVVVSKNAVGWSLEAAEDFGGTVGCVAAVNKRK